MSIAKLADGFSIRLLNHLNNWVIGKELGWVPVKIRPTAEYRMQEWHMPMPLALRIDALEVCQVDILEQCLLILKRNRKEFLEAQRKRHATWEISDVDINIVYQLRDREVLFWWESKENFV